MCKLVTSVNSECKRIRVRTKREIADIPGLKGSREAVNSLQLFRVISLSDSGCYDQSPSCSYWALTGQCHNNPNLQRSCCVWCNHMKSMYLEMECSKTSQLRTWILRTCYAKICQLIPLHIRTCLA